ncbi:MAG: nickel pincer cofactor biosynthesis protein LarC [Chloroflexi bacterium]|nr:nickel pincer cofactor biosynthesis protein LarC [Chloroflexota bacterium]
MRVGYVDGVSGASGDMLLGALLACGWENGQLEDVLRRVLPGAWSVHTARVHDHDVSAVRVRFSFDTQQPLRHLSDLVHLVEQAQLSEAIRQASIAVLTRLGEVEASIHGVDVSEVHFHEIGAADTLADIVGCCAGLAALNIEKLFVGPLNVGGGQITIRHGRVPVPPPAVRELTRALITYGTADAGELLTPTGAALLSVLGTAAAAQPPLCNTQTGFGAGTKQLPWANVVRITTGQLVSSGGSTTLAQRSLHILTCNIDDMQPEFYATVLDKLLSRGALDAWISPILMKKGRPALQLSTLCDPQETPSLQELLFRETTTLGIRVQTVERIALDRRWETVETPFGAVRIKLGILNGQVVNVAPEFEDCARVARSNQVPEKLVFQAAIRAYDGTYFTSPQPHKPE